MSTMPSCPALIYIENGALPFAQMLVRPLSMLAGHSYTSAGEFHPSLIKKIAAIALTIIFLPLAIPAISLSFLALSLSSSHKEQCAALFAPQPLPPQIDFRRLATPSEDPGKEQEELENAKIRANNFIREISTSSIGYSSVPLLLEAPVTARNKVTQATTFAEIVEALETLRRWIYIYKPSREFNVYMVEIQSKAKKPYESFINDLKGFVTSIKAEVKPLESSPGADELKNLCEYFDVIACYDIPEYWNCIQQIAGKYESVVGHQHEMLEDYLESTYALLITPAAA